MRTPHSRYDADAAPDYSHRFHAGNVGDVWKHCVLVEILRRTSASAIRVIFLETHAGEGSYALGATGEWTEGIGRLWATLECAGRDDALARYLALCRRLGAGAERPVTYPGSPVLAAATLGSDAELRLWERDEAAFARLAAHTRGDGRVRLARGDGLRSLGDELRDAESHADAVVVFVDPPYTEKADWTRVPDALALAARASTHAAMILWYPVKSLTRPNAMVARLEAAGVSGMVAELITTPLEHKRRRLNGSGVLLVRPPAGTREALAAAAPSIGERCATFDGVWSFRMRSFAGRATQR